MRLLIFSCAAMIAACDDQPMTASDARPDAAPMDAARIDASPMDAAVDAGSSPDASDPDADAPDADEPDAVEADAMEEDGGIGPFVVTSSAFVEGAEIPRANSCYGIDRQPDLTWSGAPAGTMSFAAVLIDDTIDYVHWVAYGIPPTTTSLPAGASDDGLLPAGTQEADAYCVEYCGPCPGQMHQYSFRIYALDVATIAFTAQNPIDDADLDAAFDANTLGIAALTGTFTP
jgi:Raf kinase inhibitor-like YbhB/YbcL family protein